VAEAGGALVAGDLLELLPRTAVFGGGADRILMAGARTTVRSVEK
jgi:hypothetical protein